MQQITVFIIDITAFQDLLQKEKKKSAQCSICQKVFVSSQCLSWHMNCHRDVKEKYKCKICGLTYTWITSLYHHMKVHKELLPFSCNFCTKQFKNIKLSRNMFMDANMENIALTNAHFACIDDQLLKYPVFIIIFIFY